MFKWINKQRFPLGTEVYVETYGAFSGITSDYIGIIQGYVKYNKLLVLVDDTSFYTFNANDCTKIENTESV